MKLSELDIKDMIFKELESSINITFTNIIIGNGYFIHEFGENSVVHFQVKEISNWKFGIWIVPSDEENTFRVDIFGEREDYIDKFKPTQTTIAEHTYVRTDQEWEVEFDDAIRKIRTVLSQLKTSRKLTEYNLFYDPWVEEKFIPWLIDDIQGILRYKWMLFFDKYLCKYRAKLITKAIKIVYRKYIKDAFIRINTEWHPKYEIVILIDKNTSQDVIQVLMNKFYHAGFWISWVWFLGVRPNIDFTIEEDD